MNIFLILMSLFLVSCATKGGLSKEREDQITTDMGAFNQRALGYLFRGPLKGNVSNLTKDTYLKLVLEIQEPSESDYVEFLKTEDLEIEIRSEVKNFFVCMKSESLVVVLCDKASTAFVDFVGRDPQIDIKGIFNRL